MDTEYDDDSNSTNRLGGGMQKLGWGHSTALLFIMQSMAASLFASPHADYFPRMAGYNM
jgi:hypothetical protein